MRFSMLDARVYTKRNSVPAYAGIDADVLL